MAPVLLIFTFVACKAPPPAPDGLDASVRHLYRGFYDADADIGAGLTGLMDWLDAEGDELLDQRADLDSVGAFSLDPLSRDDIADRPVEHNPDPALAAGVVSLAEMACVWTRAEELLVRPDQDAVFDKDFDEYSRQYVTARSAYEDAANAGDFDIVKDAIPLEEVEDHEEVLLLTSNTASSTEVGVTLEFDLELQFRHGEYEVQGEDVHALLIMSYLPRSATSDGGGSTMEQSWSIDVNLEQPGNKTLRVFASWIELDSTFVDSDSALVKTSAVNKAQDSAERLSDICSGDVQI